VAFKVLDRGKRGHEPREIISSVKTLKTPLAAISQGEWSGLSAGVGSWYGVYR